MPTNDPFTPITGDPLYVAKAFYYDANYAKERDFITQCVLVGLLSAGSGIGMFYYVAQEIYNWVKNKYDGTPLPQATYQGLAPTIRVYTSFLRPNQHSYGANTIQDFQTRIEMENIHAEEGDRDYNDYLYYGKWLYPKLVNLHFFYEKGEEGRNGRYRKKKRKHDNDNEDQNRDNNDAGEGGNGGAPFAGGGPSTIPFPPAPPPVPLEEEEEEIIADIIENIE
ncbi:MAG TPA: hypothetical protein V6C58_10890, partial [Allocoleopsis sp.]